MVSEHSNLAPDLCVIGGGAGGLTAAAAAAAMGVPVVLIEKDRLGGQSLNSGSVPSKALLTAARHADALRAGARFGVKNTRTGIDFTAVSAFLREVVGAVAPQASAERLTGLGVRVVPGTARFKDAETVTVGDINIRPRRFVIATGSLPVIPAIPGLSEIPYLTPETIFDLGDCPRHLIIVGAGRIGLELAQTFRRLGAEVSLLEAAVPLKREDRECAQIVLDALGREGVSLRTGVQITQVRRALARVQVLIAKGDDVASGAELMIEGSHILLAAGRRPNIDDLDLDTAGIRSTAGGIVVDKHLRTTNKKVYAIGDVTGGAKFTHAANHHAGLVVRNALFRHSAAIDQRLIPRVTFTDPELAHVGFLEDEARAQSGAIRVLRWSYRENDRALTSAATEGQIKVITDRDGGILGASIVGVAASENVAAWTLAIGQKLKIGAFAELIVPYPTYAEVGKRAAITYFMQGLTSVRVRRIIGWLRLF